MTTLTNVPINARSMNGLITISDGTAILENGDLTTTGDINSDTVNTNTLSTDNFILPRISTPAVISSLGTTINVEDILQNIDYGNANRLFVIVNDVGNNMMLLNTSTNRFEITSDILDMYPNQISINSATLFDTGSVNFSNTSVTHTNGSLNITNCPVVSNNTIIINRASVAAVKTLLGSSTEITALLQNLYFNSGTRNFEIWNDAATIAMIGFDVANNTIAIRSPTTFNTSLPTSTLTPTTATQLVTKTYVDSTFGRLAFANVWTNTNTFNSFLPTSSLTPTLATQFVTKGFTDGAYARLAVANSFSENNTFLKGILPRTALTDTNIQVGSLNMMGNRQATSLNNVGVGVDCLKGDAIPSGYIYATGSQNTACGNFALMQQGTGSRNCAFGFEAMKLTGLERIYGAGVSPSNCIAIGAGSQKQNLYGSDNVSIGYNSLNNVGSGSSNIIIGSNVGNGLGNAGDNVIIGKNAMTVAVDNGIVCIGSSALESATGTCNSGVFVGFSAGRYNTNGNSNTFIGGNSGLGNTIGSQNQCFGVYAGRLSLSYLNYTTCIGYDSRATQNNEFVIGGESYLERADLTLPNKTRLACNQIRGDATVTLNFRTDENVILNSATTTVINLPAPTGQENVGCKIFVQRAVTGVNITINAPAGQLVAYLKYEGTYTTGSSYTFKKEVANIRLLCIGSTAGAANWVIMNSLNAEASDTLYVNSTVSIPATKYSIPFGGTTSAAYQTLYMDNANLNYQASTSTLTVTSVTSSGTITSSGTLNATGTFRITNYRPYEIGAIVNNATSLPGAPTTLYGSYTFSSGTADAVVVLPTITVAMTGCPMIIRRIANTSFQLIIKTAAGSSTTIIQRASIATTAENTNYILLTTAQFFTTIMPLSTTQWAVLN